ncbi:protein O-mannosyl-transferase family [Candidatus Leptofilum sp.]|uniref:protein O-mannosyl-transferase family n=1 Tax=Candidatus Leptofilum sp. TaxID=3241576 RepID=UPI003B58CA5F
MTNYSKNRRLETGDWRLKTNLQSLISSLFLLITLLTLYLLTLAQSPVLGDPSEYTFVANMLGIAHPPGYAFITLLGKLFQTIIPIGTVAWRMHLLAAVSASLGAWFVFGIIRTVARKVDLLQEGQLLGTMAALFGAFVVGTAVNHWQHAIHANPHILTATFTAANLFFLTKWWAENEGVKGRRAKEVDSLTPSNKWLCAFCFSAGLGVTHHPLTVFGFPAYALFILSVWLTKEFRDWRLETGNTCLNLQSVISSLRRMALHNWQTVLKMVGFALLGLSVWLYFPIRSPMDPGFGPTTMNTLNGFLDHILARGLSDSLPYVSLADQPNRARVFWSLLRLQFSWPVILLALFGLLWPIFDKVNAIANRRRQGKKETSTHPFTLSPGHLVTLFALTFLGTYAFVISLRAQDSMAYLVGPFLIVGLFAGLGLLWLLVIGTRMNVDGRGFYFALAFFFIAGPIWQVWQNMPRVSLRDYDEGQTVIEAVEHWADGQESGAVLLSDWERMTPLWHERYVNGNWPNPAVVTPQLVAAGTANPWLDAIFANLPAGPVYLSNFRQGALAGTEFRLRPSSIFYQVVEPGDTTVPEGMIAVTAVANDIEIVAYDLPEHHATTGDFVPLTLAMRAPAGTQDFYVPVLYVGDLRYEFTTDSHLITPNWWENEVIVERFDFALPHDLAGGVYPLRLNMKNLSQNEEIPLDLDLGPLSVNAVDAPPETEHLLANFRQRVGLVSASARVNGDRAAAPWTVENLNTVQRGDIVNVTLEWEALAKAEESYTIFVHLIDSNNVPYVFLDYTPLGGSAPTHLWIPKWLPGQRFIDPYRLTIPPDLPPGTYFIEVGLYEMVSGRRLHISDHEGNLNGDRYILGPITVQ